MVVDDNSVPVTSIQKADGLKKPRIKASLSGRGHKRTLRYRVTPRKGQVVTFIEDGPSAGRRIGVAKKSSGNIPFRPADGRSERRAIYALVSRTGSSETAFASSGSAPRRRSGRQSRGACS